MFKYMSALGHKHLRTHPQQMHYLEKKLCTNMRLHIDMLMVLIFFKNNPPVGGLLSTSLELVVVEGTGSKLSQYQCVITTMGKTNFLPGFCAMLSCKMSSVLHTYEQWKLGVQPETDAGSELLTLFSVTYPGLAELSKLISSNSRLHY